MSSPLRHLPPELIPEILSYLPVKDLLRYRSVSSSWHSLIDSSYFTKLHLSRSQKTRSNLLLLSKDEFQIFSTLDVYSLQKVPDLKQPPVRKNAPFSVHIIGSCNGLVVLCYEHVYYSHKRYLSLWNPSTRKFRKLPSPEIIGPEPFGIDKSTSVSYGFGYDSEKCDYKLVQSNLINHDFTEGAVFSVKSNTWRPINCPFHIGILGRNTETSKAVVNNAPHWVISRRPSKIVAFDFVKEEYYLVPLPEGLPLAYFLSPSLLGDCLSMAIHPAFECCADVWVMNEYGVKESWSKLFSLPLTNPFPSIFGNPSLVSVAYSRNGDRVLLNYNDRFLWYDLMRKTVECVKMDGDVYNPGICVGSLVWPRRKKHSSRVKI